MAIEITVRGNGSGPRYISSRTGKEIDPETAAKEAEANATKSASPCNGGLRPSITTGGSTKKWHRGGRRYRTAYIR